MTVKPENKILDASDNNWVDRFAPAVTRPYLRLARADRPIGTWLLLLPCFWSLALAAGKGEIADLRLMLLFTVGAFIMRGAGCTVNDLIDRNFDSKVERTRSRPLPSGQISVPAAIVFLVVQMAIGFYVLLQFNTFTINLGLWSLPLVVLYPYVKRVSYWPQFVLGLTFNWGALMGWAAVRGEISEPAILLYIGGVFWTLGYDTIYAHQDKEDDAIVGIKSSAIKLGDQSKPWLLLFYVTAAVFFTIAGNAANLGPLFLALMGVATFHLVWQIIAVDVDNPASCLKVFKSNASTGWVIFFAITLGQFI